MLQDIVGLEAFSDFREVSVGRRRFTGTANPGLRIANNTLARVDKPGRPQRNERQQDGCGVAARIRHQASFLYRVAVELDQSIGGFFQKLRKTMVETVPLRVQGCLL